MNSDKSSAENSSIGDTQLSQELRQNAHELYLQIINHFISEDTEINELIFVPLMILSRIIRTQDAIELLIKNNHPSEASVLALTQFELRLDLIFTSSDVKKSAEWLDHEDTRWSLMRVSERIDSIFSNESERSIFRSIFRCLSGIKHANPIYSELGFPARVEGKRILVSTGDIDDEFSKNFSNTILRYSFYQLAFSANTINVFIARYAKVDEELRVRVRDRFLELKPIETEFSQFLEQIVITKKGSFDLKKWKAAKKS